MRALDVIAAKREFHHAFDLLQGHEFRNLDAVGIAVGIQQGPAIAARGQLFVHYLAARGAQSTWARRHVGFLLQSSTWKGGAPSPSEPHSRRRAPIAFAHETRRAAPGDADINASAPGG